MNTYLNNEEAHYQRMWLSLERVAAEDAKDLEVKDPGGTVFRLPSRLRGWYLLKNSGISRKDHPNIIREAGGGTHFHRIHKILKESYRDDLIRSYDESAGSRLAQTLGGC